MLGSLVVLFVLVSFILFHMTITRRIIDIDQQAFERRRFSFFTTPRVFVAVFPRVKDAELELGNTCAAICEFFQR